MRFLDARELMTSVLGAGTALLLLAPCSFAHAGIAWTTDASGAVPAGSIYERIGDVFLSSGGLTPSDAQLASYYVFQVTDPTGATLLSRDKTKCRVFRAGADGGIEAVVSSSEIGGGSECSHDTIGVPGGGTAIDLMAYAKTPDAGKEYRVWVASLGSVAEGCVGTQSPEDIAAVLELKKGSGLNSCGGFFGFSAAESASDRYTIGVGSLGSIAGHEYYDANHDEGYGGGEAGIANWPIKLCRLTHDGGNRGALDVGECAETRAGTLGHFGFVGLGDGSYLVREGMARDLDSDPEHPAFNGFDWMQMAPHAMATTTPYASAAIDMAGFFDPHGMNGVHQVVVVRRGEIARAEFGNVALALLPIEGGLDWSYWRNNSGFGQGAGSTDPIFLSPLGIDLGSPAGVHLDVGSGLAASTVFSADGSGADDEPPWASPQEIADLCSVPGGCRTSDFAHPASCGQDCHEKFAVDLLALELNLLSGEFSGDAFYVNPADPRNMMTVDQIRAEAHAELTAWFNGTPIDFHPLHDALANINANATTGVLFVMDHLPEAPAPLCFVGFDCSM